jgi:hypothetical protein
MALVSSSNIMKRAPIAHFPIFPGLEVFRSSCSSLWGVCRTRDRCRLLSTHISERDPSADDRDLHDISLQNLLADLPVTKPVRGTGPWPRLQPCHVGLVLVFFDQASLAVGLAAMGGATEGIFYPSVANKLLYQAMSDSTGPRES